MLLTYMLCMAYSAFFLIEPRTSRTVENPPTRGSAHPSYSLRKCLTAGYYGDISVECFLLSDESSLCQVVHKLKTVQYNLLLDNLMLKHITVKSKLFLSCYLQHDTLKITSKYKTFYKLKKFHGHYKFIYFKIQILFQNLESL